MPEPALTPERRHVVPGGPSGPLDRAGFVELGLMTCFSFLRGASDPVDLVTTARALGYDSVGIADVNSLAGVVRFHVEALALGLRPVIGCRIETVEGLSFLAYPRDRAAYGRLCRLISAGRMATPDGAWQEKGRCDITLAMLAAHGQDVALVVIPPRDLDQVLTIAVPGNVVPLATGNPPPANTLSTSFAGVIPHVVHSLPGMRHVAAGYIYCGDDVARINAIDAMARAHGLTIMATNDVLYHEAARRPLHDVMTAISHKCTVANAGHWLEPHAERHLKSPETMTRLFDRWPHALTAARTLADGCTFALTDLRYEYPEEICPDGRDPQDWLDEQTWIGAKWRYPGGVPEGVADTLRRELALIGRLDLPAYFLTVKDIVDFARAQDPPILCQGRGSAANSAVC